MCVCGLNGNSVFYRRKERLLHVTYRPHRLLFFSRTRFLLLHLSRTFISNRTVMIIRVRLTLSRDVSVLHDMRASLFRHFPTQSNQSIEQI